MSESLDRTLEEHFRGKPDSELIRRMETAPDFGYDDEEYELNRRLGARALTWKWDGDRVVIYSPEESRLAEKFKDIPTSLLEHRLAVSGGGIDPDARLEYHRRLEQMRDGDA